MAQVQRPEGTTEARSLPDEDIALQRVALDLAPHLLALVDAYAAREGISRSEAVEDALLAWLARDNLSALTSFRREIDCC